MALLLLTTGLIMGAMHVLLLSSALAPARMAALAGTGFGVSSSSEESEMLSKLNSSLTGGRGLLAGARGLDQEERDSMLEMCIEDVEESLLIDR